MRSLRVVIATMAGVVVLLGTATPAWAHGIGGRADLPVPLSFFVVGAGAAIVISFLAVSVLWTRPRLQEPRDLGPARVRRFRAAGVVLRVLGLAALGLVIANGIVDGRESAHAIGPTIVWVYFWLVVPFLVAIVGNVWPWLSPWRAISGSLNASRPERSDLASRIGVWPATGAFVAFTWLELVSPQSGEPETLAVAAVVYVAYIVVAGRILGPETAAHTADAFEQYNRVLGGIAPVAWNRPRSLGALAVEDQTAAVSYRGWLRGLPALELRPGLATFIVAMIGTVTYDGMSGTEWWSSWWGGTARDEVFGTIALLATVAAIGAGYLAAAAVAARLAGAGWGARRVAFSFAHTLVPIALAYAVAHYFTLVLFEGQLLLSAASDPFGLGWDLLGTADWRVVFFLSPEAVWYIQVAVIVTGHVLGVALAHDRALAEFGGVQAIRTQYAMLVLMVALTSLGLLVLAG